MGVGPGTLKGTHVKNLNMISGSTVSGKTATGGVSSIDRKAVNPTGSKKLTL